MNTIDKPDHDRLTDSSAVLAALAFARAAATDDLSKAYDQLLPYRRPNEGIWECALRILADRIAPVADHTDWPD